MTKIQILNASTMRFVTSDKDLLEHVQFALELPTKKGNDVVSLLLPNGTFPNRLHRLVSGAVQEYRGWAPEYVWHCPKPIISGKQSRVLQTPGLVESWKLRGEYQQEGINALLDNMGGVLNAAAGSGKTKMAAFTLDALSRLWPAKERMKLVWLAQTQEQVDQAQTALDCLGMPFRQRCLMYLSCWQSFFSAGRSPINDSTLREADVLVVDECHSSSDSIFEIAQNCTNAWIRIGLTATLVRTDDRELLIEAMFGKRVCHIDQKRVQGEGHLLPGHAVIYEVGIKNELVEVVKEEAQEDLNKLQKWGKQAADQATEVNRIIYRHARQRGVLENPKRNALVAEIANDLLEQDQIVLIIVGSVKQGRILQAAIPESVIVHSKMKVGEGRRDEIMTATRKGKVRCMIATSLADQGLDIPCLDALIMAAGGKGGKEGYLVEQRAARVQRTSEGKTRGLVIDFMDHGHPKLAFQSYERVKKYKTMRFAVDHISPAQNSQIFQEAV